MQLKYNKRKIQQHVLVTPEIAKEILDTHNEKNRRINKNYVEQFKHALVNGYFKEVNAITINKSGTLQDGQHRLRAIVETGIPAYMTIIFGQDDEDFDLTNTGHAMTINEFACTNSKELEGVKSIMYSAITIVKHMHDTGMPRGTQVPKREIKKLIVDDIDTWRFLSNRGRSLPKHMYNRPALYALEYAIYKTETEENKKKVIEFFDNLWNNNIHSETNPVEHAYVSWIGNQKHTGVTGEMTTLCGTYYAWDAFKKGKKIQRLHVPSNYELPKELWAMENY